MSDRNAAVAFWAALYERCIEPDLRRLLGNSFSAFMKDSNPVVAFQTFVLARKAGIPVPDEVMDYISGSFEKWLEKRGTESLDKILGLSARGKENAWNRFGKDAYIDALMREIWQLPLMFPVSTEEAIDMVAARIEKDAEECQRSGYEVFALTRDTLERYYYGDHGKPWREIPDSDKAHAWWPEHELTKRFETYPKHSWQNFLRSSTERK